MVRRNPSRVTQISNRDGPGRWSVDQAHISHATTTHWVHSVLEIRQRLKEYQSSLDTSRHIVTNPDQIAAELPTCSMSSDFSQGHFWISSCLPTIRELGCFAEIAELLGTDWAPNLSELNQCGRKAGITLSRMLLAKALSSGACPCSHRKNRGPLSASISNSGSVVAFSSQDAIASSMILRWI
jgi:hypothetical protein